MVRSPLHSGSLTYFIVASVFLIQEPPFKPGELEKKNNSFQSFFSKKGPFVCFRGLHETEERSYDFMGRENRLFVSQDQNLGFAFDRATLNGIIKSNEGAHQKIKVSLGGAITIGCRIFVDNELIYPDYEV